MPAKDVNAHATDGKNKGTAILAGKTNNCSLSFAGIATQQ